MDGLPYHLGGMRPQASRAFPSFSKDFEQHGPGTARIGATSGRGVSPEHHGGTNPGDYRIAACGVIKTGIGALADCFRAVRDTSVRLDYPENLAILLRL